MSLQQQHRNYFRRIKNNLRFEWITKNENKRFEDFCGHIFYKKQILNYSIKFKYS